MLADGEKLKKNPITPLEVNITPISQEILTCTSLAIMQESGSDELIKQFILTMSR
jgi:hypothetical protein